MYMYLSANQSLITSKPIFMYYLIVKSKDKPEDFQAPSVSRDFQYLSQYLFDTYRTCANTARTTIEHAPHEKHVNFFFLHHF